MLLGQAARFQGELLHFANHLLAELVIVIIISIAILAVAISIIGIINIIIMSLLSLLFILSHCSATYRHDL